MHTLMYFLIWGALIFVMMRFGCGAHVMGHVKPTRDTNEKSTNNVEQNNEHRH